MLASAGTGSAANSGRWPQCVAGVASAANNGCWDRCLRALAPQALQIMGAGIDAVLVSAEENQSKLQVRGGKSTFEFLVNLDAKN